MTKEAFSQLVVQYERLVYTICFQLVRDAAAAEDLTQETFLSAYLHRDTMPAGYERQWLARIAANKAKDICKAPIIRRTVLPGDEEAPGSSRRGGDRPSAKRGSGYFPLDPGTQRALPGRSASCACWRRNPRRKPRWHWADRSRRFTHSSPAESGFCGNSWKEEIGWNVFALMDT